MINAINKLIESKELDIAEAVLRALAHPLRLKILSLIASRTEITVNTIHSQLQLDQSITSQQLRILRNAELVKTTRNGKFILYSLNIPKIERIVQAVYEYTGHIAN